MGSSALGKGEASPGVSVGRMRQLIGKRLLDIDVG